MSDKNKKDPIERLAGLFGGKDPLKQSGSQTVLTEALQEVQKERDEENKKAAIDLIKQALDVRKNMDNVRKEFEGKYKKFEKNLGKLLGKIEQFARGSSSSDSESNDSDNNDDESSSSTEE